MTASQSTSIDEARLNAFMGKMVGDMSAAIGGALVLIGDKLGLYKALAEGGPATSGQCQRNLPLSVWPQLRSVPTCPATRSAISKLRRRLSASR